MHITSAFVAAAILNGMAKAAPYLSARTTPAPTEPAKRGDWTLDFDWRQAAHEALPAPTNEPSKAYENWANVVHEANAMKRAAATVKREAAPSKREAEAAPTKRAAISSKARREAAAAPDDRDHKGRRDGAPMKRDAAPSPHHRDSLRLRSTHDANSTECAAASSKREAEPAPTKREAEAAPTKREAEAAPSKRAAEPAPTKRAAAPSKREADAAPTKRAAMPSKREAEAAPSKREADPAPTKRAALPLGPIASFDPDHTLYSDEEEVYRDEITAEPFIPPSKRDPEAAPSKRSAEAAPTKRATPTAQWNTGVEDWYNQKRTLPIWDKFSNGDFFLQERSLPPNKRGRSGYNRVAEDSDDDDAVLEKRTLPIWEKFEDYDYADFVKRALGYSRINTVEDTDNNVVIGLKERTAPPRGSVHFEKRSLSPVNDGQSGVAETSDDGVAVEERAVPGIKRPWS